MKTEFRQNMTGNLRKVFLVVLAMIASLTMTAKDKKVHDAQAKQLFEKAFEQIFGQQGSTLDYVANVAGIYKNQGTIIYKGNKFKYVEKRHLSWSDGVTIHKVDKKKRKVFIYKADDEKKETTLSKFKFDDTKFLFSHKVVGDTYVINAKVKDASFTGVRDLQLVVKKANLIPITLKIKIALFSANVKISNVKIGGIEDSEFVFPKKQYEGYEVEDHR